MPNSSKRKHIVFIDDKEYEKPAELVEKITENNKKRTRARPEDFIDEEDDDDYPVEKSYEELEKEKLSEKHIKKLRTIRQSMKDKEIEVDDILELDLSEDDMMWFVEYIDIYKHIEPYTEEKYRVKTLIFDKFKSLEKQIENRETLEKLKKLGDIDNDIVHRILNSKHSDYVKSVVYKKWNSILDLSKNDEYFKQMEWIDTVLDMPTEIKHINAGKVDISEQLTNLRNEMDKRIYGLDNVKEKVLEAYCAMISNPYYKKKFIALVGPPGVGKTAIAEAIASAMNLPFDQISFGGIKDATTLTGHSSTYIGARPGLFVTMLKKAKVLNPVTLLDEIDKIPDSPEGKSINSVLLHILDKTQNSRFQDMYMPEVPADMSNIFFILAMNDDSQIDDILKDRISIIRIDGYNAEEKTKIGADYIVPKIRERLAFNKGDVSVTYATMDYIVEKLNSKEKGVRDMEKIIETLFERLNVIKHLSGKKKKIKLSYHIDDIKFPLVVTKKVIDSLWP
jgi:ATP-dependent Lon protease